MPDLPDIYEQFRKLFPPAQILPPAPRKDGEQGAGYFGIKNCPAFSINDPLPSIYCAGLQFGGYVVANLLGVLLFALGIWMIIQGNKK